MSCTTINRAKNVHLKGNKVRFFLFKSLTMRLSLPHRERTLFGRVVTYGYSYWVVTGDVQFVQSLTNVVHEGQSEVSLTRSKFSFRFVRHVLNLQREIPSLQIRAKKRKHSRCEFNTMRVNREAQWMSSKGLWTPFIHDTTGKANRKEPLWLCASL